jgi:hypothetical protein
MYAIVVDAAAEELLAGGFIHQISNIDNEERITNYSYNALIT